MIDSLSFNEGERELFRSSLLPDEIRYYVDVDILTACRDAAATMSEAQWRDLGAKGGYHINVLVAYGPSTIACKAIEAELDSSDSIRPLGGALAVIGEAAIPLVIRTLTCAVGNIGKGVYANQISTAVADIAPVRSTRVAELLLDVLASKAKPTVKASARAWLARHAVVAQLVIEAALADPKRKKTAAAAAKALAKRR
jgi:hypothetical protein